VFRQALDSARFATKDRRKHLKVMQDVARWVAVTHLDRAPASLSRPLYKTVVDVTGNRDPYRAIKARCNRTAMRLLPYVQKRVNAARDPLHVALKAAAAGNIIDLGVGQKFDIKRDIPALLDRPFRIDATDELRRELKPGARVLYIGDNAGEIVFDIPLLRQMLKAGARVTFAVKSGPIVNDATMSDARMTGLADVVPVIETGSNDIGVDWTLVSRQFLKAVESSHIVISKGHGNFETCDERPENFYYLLKCKCHMVAEALGVDIGDLVLVHKPRMKKLRRKC